ncbi:MAG: hypothetical protein ACOZAL_01390 [Patescibacteria group bacterium]
MIILIAQIIFIISVIGILVIILRKVPIILRYPRHPYEEISFWERIRQKASSSRFFHEVVIPKIEKILRKLKIILLKFDNFLARKVDKLRDKIRKKKEEEEEMPM